ncbi:MAG TPA: 50S ribosomal protein L13 [Thermomicrobiales bacterium]|nr:50S ribosomal protein L13 [Thermomicrobiales bacterium]
MSVKTYVPKESEIERKWYIVDAEDAVLGRLATEVASILRGKHKPQFTPHLDAGDYVIVVNAEKVRVTGAKENQKMYYRHSRYPGGLRSMTFNQMIEKHPERVIEAAVRGMLPKNALGRRMLRKLRVFTGPDHPHAAQQPIELNVAK